jgi:hypothetical protein
MTSILEVEQLDTLSSNASSTLTIGGDNTTTIAFGPNVTTTPSSLAMTPAFHAFLSSTQSLSDDTTTKVQCNSELYDTDNCYDNSTNYRFTPTVAGKYFVYGSWMSDNSTASTLQYGNARIRKNGSDILFQVLDFRNNYAGYSNTFAVSGVVDFNGTTDYVELYATIKISSGTTGIGGNATHSRTAFGAYRIIGA